MRMITAAALCLALLGCHAPQDEPSSDHNEQSHEAPNQDIPGGPGLPQVPDIADEAGGEDDATNEAQPT